MVNFLKYKFVYLFFYFLIIAIGLFSIFKWGFHYSIDFVGGTSLEYKVNHKVYNLRTKPLDQQGQEDLIKKLEKEKKGRIEILKMETVGPTLGKETIAKTAFASALAVLGILIYMGFSFKGYNYAFSAIVAMVCDLFVVVGSYSLISHFFGAELDTMFVTAVLTTMSFSVHDTIVIFDKIREYFQTEDGHIEYFANKALTETMVRSFNNSMTIVFMLLSLSLMGGSTIRFFVITLLIGTVTGTYSSPFVATPILVWLDKISLKSKT